MSSHAHSEEFSEALEKKSIDIFDFPTILTMVALIGIGLISIYSATFDAQMSRFFEKQLAFAIVGFVTMIVAIFLPQHWLKTLSPVMYAVSILLLIAVLFPGIGLKINGQRCWISIAGFQFQPSEFAKLSTLLMIGRYMEGKGINLKTIRDLGQLCGIVLLPLVLVLAEKDTGTASAFVAMLMGALLWGGGDLFLLYISCAIPVISIIGMYGVLHGTKVQMIVSVAIATACAFLFRRSILVTTVSVLLFVAVGLTTDIVYNKLPEHQQSRIKTYFEPEKYPKDEGYHVLQSMMAVGSGGLTGKGFMKGTLPQLRYIPEQWTDFIYDVPGEEFGFIGSVTVLGLSLFLIYRIVRIARICHSHFESMFAFSFATVLLYHAFINIGMAIGLVPVMGIPLPFLSSGGTALIVNMTSVGIVISFYRSYQRSLQV